jgi:hypothetical protein
MLLKVVFVSFECNADDGWRREAERLKARIDDCLYNVLAVLEGLVGERPDEWVTGFWMIRCADPHAALEEATA